MADRREFLRYPPEMLPWLPLPDARQLLSDTQHEAHVLGEETHRIRGTLGTFLYQIIVPGGDRLAQKIAPATVAEINVKNARTIFERSKRRERRMNWQSGKAQTPGIGGVLEEEIPSGSTQASLRTDALGEREITEYTSTGVAPETLASRAEENSSPSTPDTNGRIDWRQRNQQLYDEWSIWNKEDDQGEEAEEPFVYFDPEERQVGGVKKASNSDSSATIIEFHTNETLEQFVQEVAGRNPYFLHDLRIMTQYVIKEPVGTGTHVLRGGWITVDHRTFRLRRLNPAQIPQMQFADPRSRSLRVIYFYDKRNNTVVLRSILSHSQMRREYGGTVKE